MDAVIFHPDLAEKVIRGEKTQTRRRVKDGQPCRYVAGKSYAVQPGRGKKALGRIRVEFVDRVPVQPISEADALAEGFASPAAFFARWNEMYGTTVGDVWRIVFTTTNAERSSPSSDLEVGG